MTNDFELAIDNQSSMGDVKDWNNKVAKSICDMSFITPSGEIPLYSNWRHLDFGSISINFFQNTQMFRVVHKPGSVHNATNKCFELVFADTKLDLFHYNRHVKIPGKHFFLLDNREYFSFDVLSENSFGISLHIDPQWLIQWVPNPKLSVAQPYSAETGWGKVLLSVFETIYSLKNPEKDIPRSLIADQVGSLLSLLILPKEGMDLHTRHQVSMYSRLERVLYDNYQDSELSAEFVAAKAGISKRHVFNIFSQAGVRFGDELMRIRLEKAHTMLDDDKYNAFRVCDISWACGFSDPSHFARRFKDHFNHTPTNYRKMRLFGSKH